MLYLYAIVGRTPSLSGGRGVFGEPLFSIPAVGLSAVVGEATAAPEASRDRLVAHHEVVARLAAAQAALPARFGQLADEELITADLRAREHMLREALTLVEGCVQMTLRVGVDGEGLPARGDDVDEIDPAQLALAGRGMALPQPVEGLRRALSSTVRAEKVRVHEGRKPFASLYQLVPRTLVEEWGRALEKERVRTGARIAATGPWPVYAFAPAIA